MGENIIVTGFGPFGEHKINASWEAVKLLPKYNFKDVNLIVKEVPVLYKYIDEQIPDWWKMYNPKLVVHVGVSSEARELTIETCANRAGYSKRDCKNNLHPTGESCSAQKGKDCIQTNLDLKKVCEQVNSETTVKASLSNNAGRYLCEFIYYKSLNIDRGRTIFIHVPPVEKPYSAEQLAVGIAQVIHCALEQLDSTCICAASAVN